MALLLLLASWVFAADSFAGYRYYFGDPHAHTSVSGDGNSQEAGCAECGSLVEVFETARNNGLDWLVLSDHVNGAADMAHYPAATPEQYRALWQKVLGENDVRGEFVTVPGAELWFVDGDGSQIGHKTLMFFGNNDSLSALEEADIQFGGGGSKVDDCEEIWEWATELQARWGKILLMPHHPAVSLPMPTDWTCHNSDVEPLVEVYSRHGSSLWSNFAFDAPYQQTVEAGTVEAALDPERFALRMGFAAGTDSHDTRPGNVCALDAQLHMGGNAGGLTGIFLPDGAVFDRAAIYDAMVARRTYATSGPRVPMRVVYRSLGASLGEMGAELQIPAGQPLEVEVHLPTSDAVWVTAAHLISPEGNFRLEPVGAGVYRARLDAGEIPSYVYPAIAMDGRGYYAGACADGGSNDTEWLWASPSWIALVDGDVDGDGASWAEGDCAEGDPSVGVTVPEVWYDGIDQNCDGRDDDQDGDGFGIADDCNDLDPDFSPNAREEWYDGVDQNCDGNDADRDGDGSRFPADCDDDDSDLHPAAAEIWYDGVDQDCDGNDRDQDGDGRLVDEDCDDTRREILDCTPEPGCSGGSAMVLVALGFGRRRREKAGGT